jgi:hypothetical protein
LARHPHWTWVPPSGSQGGRPIIRCHERRHRETRGRGRVAVPPLTLAAPVAIRDEPRAALLSGGAETGPAPTMWLTFDPELLPASIRLLSQSDRVGSCAGEHRIADPGMHL